VHPVVVDEVIIAGQRFVSDRYDDHHSHFNWGFVLPLLSWYPYGYGWGYGGYHYGHHDHHDHGHHGHGHHGH
jgi:hypothetical protein